MRPQVTDYQEHEGDDWIPFNVEGFSNPKRVHALRFDDGSEWDTVNGWRQRTLPGEDPWKKLGEAHPGPTPTTPAPSAQPSASASQTAGGSSADLEGTLLAALETARRSCNSYSLSLTMDMERLSFNFGGKLRSDATGSEPGLRHGWEWSERNQTYQRSPSKT